MLRMMRIARAGRIKKGQWRHDRLANNKAAGAADHRDERGVACRLVARIDRRAVGGRPEGRARTILFNLSGHGHFDMQAYTDYFAGKLEDRDYDEAALRDSLAALPKVAA